MGELIKAIGGRRVVSRFIEAVSFGIRRCNEPELAVENADEVFADLMDMEAVALDVFAKVER